MTFWEVLAAATTIPHFRPAATAMEAAEGLRSFADECLHLWTADQRAAWQALQPVIEQHLNALHAADLSRMGGRR